MISIAFKSEYNKINLTKVSVIAEKDSFVYGLFENNLLVESGRISENELNTFVSGFSDHNTAMYFASKSTAFTHTDEIGLDTIKQSTQYQEFFDVNPNIYCCYNEDKFPHQTDNLKHFSTLINDYYKYEAKTICYAHFGKNAMTLCITGLDGFKFYNNYEIENAADVIYFIKAVLQNTNTNEDSVHILVGGYLEEQSEIYKTMFRHFQNVDKAKGQNFAAKNEAINPHSYFDHYLNIMR